MINRKAFKYRPKITGEREQRLPQGRNEADTNRPSQNAGPLLKIEVTIPLKYLSNF